MDLLTQGHILYYITYYIMYITIDVGAYVRTKVGMEGVSQADTPCK